MNNKIQRNMRNCMNKYAFMMKVLNYCKVLNDININFKA